MSKKLIIAVAITIALLDWAFLEWLGEYGHDLSSDPPSSLLEDVVRGIAVILTLPGFLIFLGRFPVGFGLIVTFFLLCGLVWGIVVERGRFLFLKCLTRKS